METPFHRFSDLFAQLGLPDDAAEIARFITHHAPLPADVKLDEWSIWTPAQARFLRDAVCDDSDWAEVVDQLNAVLKRR